MKACIAVQQAGMYKPKPDALPGSDQPAGFISLATHWRKHWFCQCLGNSSALGSAGAAAHSSGKRHRDAREFQPRELCKYRAAACADAKGRHWQCCSAGQLLCAQEAVLTWAAQPHGIVCACHPLWGWVAALLASWRDFSINEKTEPLNAEAAAANLFCLEQYSHHTFKYAQRVLK